VNGNVLLDTTIVVAHFCRDAILTTKLQQASLLYLPLAARDDHFKCVKGLKVLNW
jgi:hypothetical protein